MKKTRIRLSLFSLVLALVLFGLTIRLTGRDPLVVYWSILTGSFGSTKSFLNVLAYMLPLIMTGPVQRWPSRAVFSTSAVKDRCWWADWPPLLWA